MHINAQEIDSVINTCAAPLKINYVNTNYSSALCGLDGLGVRQPSYQRFKVAAVSVHQSSQLLMTYLWLLANITMATSKSAAFGNFDRPSSTDRTYKPKYKHCSVEISATYKTMFNFPTHMKVSLQCSNYHRHNLGGLGIYQLPCW